jgi:hypothetical protein
LDEKSLSSDNIHNIVIIRCPNFLTRNINDVRFTFNVGDTKMGDLQLVLRNTTRIGDAKYDIYV